MAGFVAIYYNSRTGIPARCGLFFEPLLSLLCMMIQRFDGRNGLCTTLSSSDGTANYSAMRQSFPLKCSNGVIHPCDADALHGVNVEPHLDQKSLILWFTQGSSLTDEQEVVIYHGCGETKVTATLLYRTKE